MSVRASGSNAPLHARDKKRIALVEKLTAKFVAEGVSPEDAKERANREARSDSR